MARLSGTHTDARQEFNVPLEHEDVLPFVETVEQTLLANEPIAPLKAKRLGRLWGAETPEEKAQGEEIDRVVAMNEPIPVRTLASLSHM